MFDKWQYWLFICNKCRKYLLRVRVVRGRPWMGQRGSTGESGLSRQWSGCTAVSYSVSVLLCCHLEWHELEHSRQELQQRFFEDYDTFFILWHDIYSRKKWNPNACPAFYSFFWCCPKGIIDTKIGMPLLLLFLKYVYEQEILMHKSPILIIPSLKAGTPRTRIWSLWFKCRKWIELSNCWTRESWKIIQLVS